MKKLLHEIIDDILDYNPTINNIDNTYIKKLDDNIVDCIINIKKQPKITNLILKDIKL